MKRMMSRSNDLTNPSFDVLSFLDTAELKQLLNDDGKMEELILDHPSCRETIRKKEDILMENRSLLDYSLSREKKLEDAKTNLQLSHNLIKEKRQELEKNKLQRGGSISKYDPETLLALLQACAAECEDDSDKMADQFVSGFLTIEEYLDKFLKKRTEAHILRTKVEKLARFLETGSFQGQLNHF